MSLVLIQYRILFETNVENGLEEKYLCLCCHGQIKWYSPNLTQTWSAKYNIYYVCSIENSFVYISETKTKQVIHIYWAKLLSMLILTVYFKIKSE